MKKNNNNLGDILRSGITLPCSPSVMEWWTSTITDPSGTNNNVEDNYWVDYIPPIIAAPVEPPHPLKEHPVYKENKEGCECGAYIQDIVLHSTWCPNFHRNARLLNKE